MGMLKGFSKEEKSWMMYDWANSVHSVIVVTVLPIFYDAVTRNSTLAVSRWGMGTSISKLLIAIFAPLLGILGDFKGNKKRLFSWFVVLGAFSCLAIAPTPFLEGIISTETLGLIILVLYVLSNVGFAGANIYYDSFLPEITTDDRMDKVSIMGYGLGYIGGSSIPLIIFLVMNLLGVDMNICLAFIFAFSCIWWLVFTQPMWKNVHQTHYVEKKQGAFRDSFRRLKVTAGAIWQNKPMLMFLLAYFFYNDGVGTIIHMSTIYGSALGLDSTQMMLALLLVQLLGLPFAMLYTRLSGQYGARKMVGVGIFIYAFICVFAFFISETWHFWVLAVLVATSQGGIQALSRSIFGKMIPEKERSGEYFGFYDIFGKFSAIMGPALFGFVAKKVSDSMLQARGILTSEASTEVLAEISQKASPYGVLSVLAIFVIGAVLYFLVLPRTEKKVMAQGTAKA